MSFDSSRFTFNPWNDFSGVVMQQGRVQLDSDWNEWLAELTRRIRAGTLDIVGQAVYPATTPNAFLIQAATDALGNATVSIGVGRMYVDGLLAENHGLPAPQSGGWLPPSVTASAHQPAWDPGLGELVGQNAILYTEQPYYPNVAAVAPLPATDLPYLFYLDVWQREVTFLEDPDLIEKAVAVDTTGRLETVWQVKWVQVGVNDTCSTLANGTTWHPAPSAGRLTTGVVQSTPAGVCCLTPNTGYTGMENQLYRVEIHLSGNASSNPPASFKWSRDNASVATVVTAISGKVITVQSTGKDNVLKFAGSDWVEITDDWLELNGLPGELHEIDIVDNTAQTITLKAPVTGAFNPNDPTRHTRAICWNGAEIALPAPGTAVTLENGVTVSFDLDPSGTQFNTGDFWTFAARAVDGTVENLVKAPPAGIHHHYARLAVATLPLSADNVPSDCRVQWPPPGSCCTAVVKVGDDIQKAIDSLPNQGGCVCLKPGTHVISQPIRINGRSNIHLHGESPGAIVQNTASGTALVLGGDVTQDICIEDITFQTTPAANSAEAITEISNGRGVAVRGCSFSALSNPAANGFSLYGNSAIEICHNAVEACLNGVLANSTEGLTVIGNTFSAPTVPGPNPAQIFSGGLTGIEIDECFALVKIEDNQISDFSNGIVVQGGNVGSAIAPNLVIGHNLVLRQALVAGSAFDFQWTEAYGQKLQQRAYGIAADIPGAAITQNTIPLTDPGHGGILAFASDIKVLQNSITSSISLPQPPAPPLSAPTLTWTPGIPNVDLGGTYTVEVTYVTATLESNPGPAAVPVGTDGGGITVTNIPISPDPNVTGRKLYGFKYGVSTTFQLITTITDNTTDTFLLTTDQPAWGPAPPAISYAWSGLPVGIVVYQPSAENAVEGSKLAGNDLSGPLQGIAIVAEFEERISQVEISGNRITGGAYPDTVELTVIENGLLKLTDSLLALGTAFGILAVNATQLSCLGNSITTCTVGIAALSGQLHTGIILQLPAAIVNSPPSASLERNQMVECTIGVLLARMVAIRVQNNETLGNQVAVAMLASSGWILGNLSSSTKAAAHFLTFNGGALLEANQASGGQSGIVAYSGGVILKRNQVSVTQGAGIAAFACEIETLLEGNTVGGAGFGGGSALETYLSRLVGSSLFPFDTACAVGIAAADCSGLVRVAGCDVTGVQTTNSRGSAVSVAVVNCAHTMVQNNRITQNAGGPVNNYGLIINSNLDREELTLTSAHVSGNYIDYTIPNPSESDPIAIQVASSAPQNTPFDVLFNDNLVIQRVTQSLAATVILSTGTLAMTGNRIRSVMPSLDITYIAGLSFVGNVISNGWTINGTLNGAPGAVLPNTDTSNASA